MTGCKARKAAPFPAPASPTHAPAAPLPMPWDEGAYDLGFWDTPPTSAEQPLSVKKKRTHTMPKRDYLDPNDDAFSAQLQTFKTNIGSYATVLVVTPAQVTAQAADANYSAYVIACHLTMQQGAQQWTKWKDFVRGGGTAPPTGTPAAPVFPTTVAAVMLGIEIRFRALVQQIKRSAGYNEGIGEALGIEGPVQSPPPAGTLQPVIDLLIEGNRVIVKWGWQGHRAFIDLCELQVDRGDGHGFVLLAYDTTPGYTDTAPFPATPVKWKYRAIYRKADAQVGVWSDEVAITVG